MGEKGARNGGRLLPASCIAAGQVGDPFKTAILLDSWLLR